MEKYKMIFALALLFIIVLILGTYIFLPAALKLKFIKILPNFGSYNKTQYNPPSPLHRVHRMIYDKQLGLSFSYTSPIELEERKNIAPSTKQVITPNLELAIEKEYVFIYPLLKEDISRIIVFREPIKKIITAWSARQIIYPTSNKFAYKLFATNKKDISIMFLAKRQSDKNPQIKYTTINTEIINSIEIK